MKILLVEDDIRQIEAVKPVLNKSGYVVEEARDGETAKFRIREEYFDAIILDLGLPKCSGLDVLKTVRYEGIKTPVLILTARDTWQEKVDGLKAGADDYLSKPYHQEELEARLEALIRRSIGQTTYLIEIAGLSLDPESQKVRDEAGNETQLTGIEFRLLRHFMLHPEKILSKTELSEHVYEEECVKDSNVIEVYVNRLRQRFGRTLIETLRGQGYRLRADQHESH